MSYEIIKADSHEEALEKSTYKVGGLCRVSKMLPAANSDGTWTILIEVVPLSKDERRCVGELNLRTLENYNQGNPHES